MKSRTSKPSILSWSLVLLLSLAAFFFWVWYERYLSLDFNELGRYYDSEADIVYTDAGSVWALPTFVFSFLSAIRLAFAIRLRVRANQALNRTGHKAGPPVS